MATTYSKNLRSKSPDIKILTAPSLNEDDINKLTSVPEECVPEGWIPAWKIAILFKRNYSNIRTRLKHLERGSLLKRRVYIIDNKDIYHYCLKDIQKLIPKGKSNN